MANYLSIAAVTATLMHIIQEVVMDILPDVTVRAGPPKNDIPPGETAVNIHPYMTSPETQMRNFDLPSRSAGGQFERNPQIALRLHYSISFSGNDPMVLQMIMGKVASTFLAYPHLTSEDIAAAIGQTGKLSRLSRSNLAQQTETAVITPEYPGLEDLSNLWTGLFQVAHRPSLYYVISPILIGADLSTHDLPTVTDVERRD